MKRGLFLEAAENQQNPGDQRSSSKPSSYNFSTKLRTRALRFSNERPPTAKHLPTPLMLGHVVNGIVDVHALLIEVLYSKDTAYDRVVAIRLMPAGCC